MRDWSAGVCQPPAPPVSGGPAQLHTHEHSHSQPLAYPVLSWSPSGGLMMMIQGVDLTELARKEQPHSLASRFIHVLVLS